MSQIPKLIVVVGETASGKTALAIELAKRFSGEIICADSWTVRREVNIGTAKPTPEEQAAVPHHLLDVVGPDEDFTAAVFKDLANQAIADIADRGKLPIMVGGTGLYIDGVVYNYSFLPAGDRSERGDLETKTIPELLELLKYLRIDVSKVDTRNKRRLIRLLETEGATPHKSGLRANTMVIGIQTDRESLRQRVEQRTDAMIEAGLEVEVRDLVERYGWDCEALKGVGYAQWRDYFSGSKTMAETRQAIISATMNLAKRQRTWFKRNSSIQWFPAPVKSTIVVDAVTTFLEQD